MSAARVREGTDELRVFLTYAAADKAYGHKLHRLLSRRLDLQVFTPETLSAGEDWQCKLRFEISRCDIFVVLLSPDAIESPWVLKELGAAWGIAKLILPVVTDPRVLKRIPIDLTNVPFVKIDDLDNPEVLDRILDHYEQKIMASQDSDGKVDKS